MIKTYSETLRDHVVFSRMFSYSFIDWAHGICGSAALQVLDVLLMEVPSSHILVGTTVASFSGGDPVTLGSEIHSETTLWHFLCPIGRFLPRLYLITRFIEVLGRVIGWTKGRPVKVIEHQIHVLCLFVLKIISDLDVSVHFYLDMGVSLSRQCPRLRKASRMYQLLIRVCLLAAGTVPNDPLYLPRTRISIAIPITTSSSEVVVAIRNTASSLSCSHLLLLHFVRRV